MDWKGGVALSYSNQSYLRFSLEESIWFQTGQEVTELVSISLDPSITIQESDQYVTIKGSLELSGEYNRDDHELEEELDSFSNPKFVQSVEMREEGVYLFSHHFPVEITIPKNRIENAFDIDVAVETFDYAFPERSCLKLSADLMITGLYGEQQHERLYEQDELDEFEEDLEIEEVEDEPPVFYTPFEIEVRREPDLEFIDKDLDPKRDDPFAHFRDEEGNSEDHVYEEETNNELAYTNDNRFETENTVEDLEHIEIEVEVEPEKEAFPEIIFSAHRNEKQPPPVPVERPMDELEEVTDYDVIYEQEETEETDDEHDENDENESPTPQGKQGKGKSGKWKNKQSLTLSEFFARKEEETHTKLTVVIVQKGDSLNSLSERYDVPVVQLQKVNQIELNQDISEGQVIYIPIAQTQR